jgi:type IV pilus assembly protein PilA
MLPRYHQTGYTIIELLVVVAILGVLFAIGVPAYRNYYYHQELRKISLSIKDEIRSIQNKAQNGAVPENEIRSSWYLLLTTSASMFETGSCDTINITNCLTRTGFNHENVALPERFTIKPIAIAPEDSDRYIGVTKVSAVFSPIDGKMTVYKADGSCLEAVVNGVCTSTTLNYQISSVDYTQQCVFHSINSNGLITEREGECT